MLACVSMFVCCVVVCLVGVVFECFFFVFVCVVVRLRACGLIRFCFFGGSCVYTFMGLCSCALTWLCVYVCPCLCLCAYASMCLSS